MAHPVRLAAVAVVLLPLLVAACGDGGSRTSTRGSDPIAVDGSSTVAPLTEAAARAFTGDRVVVGASGTGAGLQRLCAGRIDIGEASRRIDASERVLCRRNRIATAGIPVANDAIAIVVNARNTWARCLTTAQLRRLWAPGSTIDRWSQLDPRYPDVPFELAGADGGSGTFDFFTSAIVGREGASRTDYIATASRGVVVSTVEEQRGGLGYVGLSYLDRSAPDVRAIAIKPPGGTCTVPSTATVQDGAYRPLSRPLLIYPSANALDRPTVRTFLEGYLGQARALARRTLFVPLTADQLAASRKALAGLEVAARQATYRP